MTREFNGAWDLTDIKKWEETLMDCVHPRWKTLVKDKAWKCRSMRSR
jgi:hypothetical protein